MMHVRTFDARTLPDGTKQVRYRCSCGTVGSEWYVEDLSGNGSDHARKAWHAHAAYADKGDRT